MRVTGRSGSYFEPIGFAAARMDVRAFSVVMIPALAMETVCCSCQTGENDAGYVKQVTHHDFVQHTARGVGHFVELIDTADTSVAQNKSTTG